MPANIPLPAPYVTDADALHSISGVTPMQQNLQHPVQIPFGHDWQAPRFNKFANWPSVQTIIHGNKNPLQR